MYGYWRRPNVEPTAFGQAMQQAELYDPTTRAVARTYAEEATIGVGTLAADIAASDVRAAERKGAKITEDEYKNDPALYSEGIRWYEGMTRESAEVSKEFNDAARKRAQILQDASSAQSALGLGVGFAAGVVEPKNIASGVAIAAAAGPLAEFGVLGKSLQRAYQMRKTAKLGQRVMMGAAEGVAGGLAVEPTSRYSAKILQQDYTMVDSLFNVATSAAFGGLVPVVGAGARKLPKLIEDKVAAFKGRTMDVVAQEIDLASTQLASGRKVDVSVVQALERGTMATASPETVAQFTRYTETPEFKARFEGSKALAADGTPLMVYHGTKSTFDNFRDGTTFFSESAEVANTYATAPEYASVPNVRPAYLNMKNPYIFDAEGFDWGNIEFHGAIRTTEDIANFAKDNGYDGVIIKNVVDDMNAEMQYGKTAYAVFSPDQIISAFGADDLPAIQSRMDAERAKAIAEHNTRTIDLTDDAVIDYAAMDAEAERRAIMDIENEAEAEAYFTEAEAEIRSMLEQDIINEADLAEYRSALEEIDASSPVKALETLKLCFTRG